MRDDSGYRKLAGIGCAFCAFSDLGKKSIRKEWRAGAASLDLCEGIWYDVRTREALRIAATLSHQMDLANLAPGPLVQLGGFSGVNWSVICSSACCAFWRGQAFSSLHIAATF